MAKLKDESFQAVSRGLLAHLPDMTSNQAKLYLYCLLRARNNGEKKGTFSVFAVDMAEGMNWTTKVLYRVLATMEKYLKVKYSKNRHVPLTIEIVKFKALPDFYCRNSDYGTCDGNGDSNRTVTGTVTGQLPDSNPCKSLEETGLQTPNKEKKVKGEKENIKSVFSFSSFWEGYQKKTDKAKAEKLYSKVSESDRTLIREKLPQYVKSTPDVQYRKNPTTWLNGKCWNDEIILTKGQQQDAELTELESKLRKEGLI